jgi:hypothetical protein
MKAAMKKPRRKVDEESRSGENFIFHSRAHFSPPLYVLFSSKDLVGMVGLVR